MTRELVVSDEVRRALVTLRKFSLRQKPVAVVDAARVADVEKALGCSLHDEFLATLAAQLDPPGDAKILDLSDVVEVTKRLRELDWGTNRVAIGHANVDGPVYYHVGSQPPKTALKVNDNTHYLGDYGRWLEDYASVGRDFFAEGTNDQRALASWQPTNEELQGFDPEIG